MLLGMAQCTCAVTLHLVAAARSSAAALNIVCQCQHCPYQILAEQEELKIRTKEDQEKKDKAWEKVAQLQSRLDEKEALLKEARSHFDKNAQVCGSSIFFITACIL
jgi:hypothetical protein